MHWKLLTRIAPLVAICLLCLPSITHAASRVLQYSLYWGAHNTVTLRGPAGNIFKSLHVGHRVTVRHGAEVLVLSLHRVPRAMYHAKSPRVPPSPSSSSAAIATEITWLFNRINADRAVHGVGMLLFDWNEAPCSLRHSEHMAALGYITHDQFPGDICVPYATAAENVGVSYGNRAPLAAIDSGMMAEGPCPDPGCPGAEYEAHGHYVNILNPAFTRVGIGIYVENGVTWVTEDFTG